ncbi:MAG TPA: hypothetical protein HPP81_07310 [Deltaproteobacteria bacterium]|jgi:predicted transcriptional regulator|nr:hypothetical protein [Deltaproteobacteria bacterium]
MPKKLIEIAGEAPTEEKPVLRPADSIQNDKVICLECGKEMRQLSTKHLVAHGMSQKEYRKKYGFSMRTPLSAKSLTKARIKAAQKRGLPEKLQKYIEARRQSKTTVAAKSSVSAAETGKKVKRRASRRKTA